METIYSTATVCNYNEPTACNLQLEPRKVSGGFVYSCQEKKSKEHQVYLRILCNELQNNI